MAELLVSVRTAEEAEAALAGGAALIDVKEPARGALGRADADTIAAVLRRVAGRRPVSAALGELLEGSPCPPGLAFAKWGLSGCGPAGDWRHRLETASVAPGCRTVAVAYADWRRAAAPPPAEIARFACSHPGSAFLLDTWNKDGSTLLDWLPLAEIVQLSQACRRAHVPVALAGSLQARHLRELHVAEPSWFAVRGAACRDGRRDQDICVARVRLLSEAITQARHAG